MIKSKLNIWNVRHRMSERGSPSQSIMKNFSHIGPLTIQRLSIIQYPHQDYAETRRLGAPTFTWRPFAHLIFVTDPTDMSVEKNLSCGEISDFYT